MENVLEKIKKKIEKKWIKFVSRKNKTVEHIKYIPERVINCEGYYGFRFDGSEFINKHLIVRIIDKNKNINDDPVSEEIWMYQICGNCSSDFPIGGKRNFKKFNRKGEEGEEKKIVIEVRENFNGEITPVEWGNIYRVEDELNFTVRYATQTIDFRFLKEKTIKQMEKEYKVYVEPKNCTFLINSNMFNLVLISPNFVEINEFGATANIFFDTKIKFPFDFNWRNSNIQVNFGDLTVIGEININNTKNYDDLKDIAGFYISCNIPTSSSIMKVRVEVKSHGNVIGYLDGFRFVDIQSVDISVEDYDLLFKDDIGSINSAIDISVEEYSNLLNDESSYNEDDFNMTDFNLQPLEVPFYQEFLEKLFRTKCFLKGSFNFLKVKLSNLLKFMEDYKEKFDFLNRNILIHSSARGLYLIVYILLKKLSFDVNYVDYYGNSSLHYSELYNHKEVSSVLIEYGGNKNLKNKEGLCPEKFKEKYQKKIIDFEKEILHEKKKIKKQNNYIKKLSEEDILNVLSYLEVSQIFSSLGYVNKSFHNIIFGLESNYSHMWKSIVGQFGFEFIDKINYKKISLNLGVSYLKTLNEIKKIETYVNFSHKSPFRYKLISKHDIEMKNQPFRPYEITKEDEDFEENIEYLDNYDDFDDIYRSKIENDIYSFDYKKKFSFVGVQNFRISWSEEYVYEALTHSIFLEEEKIFCIDVIKFGDNINENQMVIELNIKKMIELQNNIKFKDFQRITQKKLDFDFLIRILQITSFFPHILENYYPKILEKYRRRDFIHKTNNFTEFNENVDERRF